MAETFRERIARTIANEPDWRKVDTMPLLREMWAAFKQDMRRIWGRKP